jgi:SAM-dependent methyltransferase
MFGPPAPGAMERLDEFLALLGPEVEVVTATQLAELDRRGELEVPAAEMAPGEPRAQPIGPPPAIHAPAARAAPGKRNRLCSICGAGDANSFDLDGRRCPGCGSLERQRAFAVAYEHHIKAEFDLRGKHVLALSPSASELRFLKACGIAGKTSVDIRPEAKPDIVADICDMKVFGDASQTCVLASYVMPLVYDMGAALDEIRRVLAPGGRFMSVEPTRENGSTIEHADSQTMTSWYGEAAMREYRVGRFRTLGAADYHATLEQRFDVTPILTADPVTGLQQHVYLCRSGRHDLGG